jgi:hypothetical protein
VGWLGWLLAHFGNAIKDHIGSWRWAIVRIYEFYIQLLNDDVTEREMA